MEAASWAPTGGNLQQWRVVVVVDRDRLAALAPIWRRSWEAYRAGNEPTAENAGPNSFDRQLAAADTLAGEFENLPAVAIFCHYPALIAYTDRDLERPSVVGGASLYPAVQNFLLACRAHGLGAVLTTVLCAAEPEGAEILGLPDTVGIHAAVPFGYPAGAKHGPLRRQPPETHAYRDGWKQPLT